jgi:hypothetical protein
MTPTTDTAIIKRDTVEDVVAQRNLAIDQFKIAVDALQRAKDAWERATHGCYGIHEFRMRETDPSVFIRKLDAETWQFLLQLTSLRDLMDVEARKAFDKQCREAPPEVTVDNVLATLQTLTGQAGDIFQRSIVATFEALPREFKSNDYFKFGRRIIFENAISVNRWGRREDQVSWSFYGTNYAAERMHDLDRIFHVVDGKQPPAWSAGAVQACSDACRHGCPFETQSQYFNLKGFKKGTLHVWPHRRDLIDKVNLQLAEHYGAALGRPQAA